VTRPLQIVQIDHTQFDIMIVDEASRENAGRPWITLAIDVMTRMVTGFHLALEPPSRTSVGLCLLLAVYDKTAWLAERGIDAPWPIGGLPEALHANNGADFRSRAFRAGLPQSRHPDQVASGRRAAFRRPYRAPDRHRNGRGADAAGGELQQSRLPGRLPISLGGAHDAV
jgi:transposase InsO family protein